MANESQKTREEQREGEARAAADKAKKKVAGWLAEIDQSLKREEKYRKFARECVQVYEAELDVPYNILYANTETLSPAIYSNPPRPVVKKRFTADSPPQELGTAASTLVQRILEYLVDTNEQDYTPFDDLIQNAVLEGLVPGRGIARWKYDATLTGEGGQQQVTYETVCGQEVAWDMIHFGYAKTWERLPWLSFEHHLSREECIENFDEEIGRKIELTASSSASGSGEQSEEKSSMEDEGTVKLAVVHEIWDKDTKKVIFISPGYKDGPLKDDVPDPLQLSGFFPLPKPLQLFQRISSMVPVPLYKQYKEQHEELNTMTVRIKHIIKACRVRGIYDARVREIEKLVEADDTVLVPAESSQSLPENFKLDNAIWLMPIDKIVSALQTLYQQREAIKQVIYEITGIADIIRGVSAASETLGAQQIKEKWGGMRLKRMQKRVAIYCRDALRLMAEIAVTKLSPATISAMTDQVIPTQEQKTQAQMQLDQMQQQAQMAQQQQQQPMPGPDGQPPAPAAPPPEPDPELLHIAQSPSLEEVLAMLQNDKLRSFNIDIETNSTVDIDVTEDKAEISEMMNAMGQFLNGVMGLVGEGVLPFEAAQAMLLAITRRFRFGLEVERYIKTMRQPQPPDDGQAAKAEADKAKLELEAADMQRKEKETADKLTLEKYKVDKEAETQIKLKGMELDAQANQLNTKESAETNRQNLQLRHDGRIAKTEQAMLLQKVQGMLKEFSLASSKDQMQQTIDNLQEMLAVTEGQLKTATKPADSSNGASPP